MAGFTADQQVQMLGDLGNLAAATYGSEHEAPEEYVSRDFIDANKEALEVAKNKATTPRGMDNLMEALNEVDLQQSRAVGPPAYLKPTTEGIQATVESPLVPTQVKTGALANATKEPNWNDEVSGILGRMNQRNAGAIATARENQAIEMEAGDKLIRLQKERGEVAAEGIRAKAAQDAAVAADKWNFITTAGVNTSVADSNANQIAAINAQLTKELIPLDQELNSMKAVSFLEDPLGWLANQFALPQVAARRNAIANQINTGNEAIRSQDALVSATINANAGKLATMSTAEAEAAARQKQLDATIEAQKAELATAKLKGATDDQIRRIEEKQDAEILNLQQRAEQRKEHEERLKLSKEQFALTQETRQNQQEIARERLEQQRQKAEEQADRDAKIAAAATMGGFPGIKTEKDLKNLSSAEKKRFEEIWATGGTTLGSTPFLAAQNFRYVQNAANTPANRDDIRAVYPGEQLKLGSVLTQTVREEAAKFSSTLKGPQLEEKVNESIIGPNGDFSRMKEHPEGFTKSINGVPTNFYVAPPIVEVAKQPSLAGNLAALATLETSKINAATGKATDSTAMLTTLASQIGEKGNVSQAAKDVVSMYQKIVDANNESMQFSKFGLPNQDSYSVQIPGQLYGKSTVNLLNPADVTKALLQLYRNHTQFGQSFLGNIAEGVGPTFGQ